MNKEAEVKIVTQYKSWEKPDCFTDAEQFKDYMWLIKTVRQPMDEENYCLDCTFRYQIDMLNEGRCAHPETMFVKWRTTYKEPDVEGRIVTKLTEPDTVGISNLSRYWTSPTLD